ncbi:glycine-rich RNA-binding protein 3, mitochondrial [Monomorium pharaonis]|uniref:glycine-rich RNA-binding protein 3, mitochondrial n=1 Tax=Monomorium pharaonis TaxID=307658 RepID=UPI00174663F6|nr:glycine-rich RNA-binding protein 3, mitochondrial [Monomorium pharaonis]XP_036149394.1 glycine-rich RNA-binding protein 3, mitochondrial [Monomorium pharaonis]
MTHVLTLSVILGVCCALAEKSEYTAAAVTTTTTTEQSKRLSNTEDRFLASIIHNKNSSELGLDSSDEDETKKTDKKPRTVLHRDSSLERGSSCCGTKYSSGGLARPDYHYNKIPVETGRYPSQYGERHHIDRYGWQTQGRPPGSSIGSGGRPGGGSGSGVYSGSQLGDRYGPRPVHASETANRPSALGYVGGYGYGGYGSYGRPTGHVGSIGGYGVSGTLADGDEFGGGGGGGEPAYPDANVPQGNIHAQKAIALKALAGVALIGAAAALASNPVLLPIGIVSGRRKRSETFSEEEPDFRMDYILYMLKEHLAKIQRDGSSAKLIVSPRCVARLTCEIQKDYLSNFRKDVEVLSDRKYHLTKLIRANVLNTNTVSSDVKDLIKRAVGVASENRNCDVFICSYVRKG